MQSVLFHPKRPSSDWLERFLSQQEELQTSYTPLPGDVTDHCRVRLGQGADAFARAKEALMRWRMFDIGWVHLVRAKRPIEVGRTVGPLVRLGPLWIANACRITAFEETSDRVCFTYVTLPGHVECGEERFSIERDPDGSVHYDLWARSRPGHPLTRIGYPFCRLMQKRFQRHSTRAMQKAVDAELLLEQPGYV